MKYMAERKHAEEIIKWAEKQNPGPWVDHSKNVAKASERIATALLNSGKDVNPDSAYVCGLLHDIGRYKGFTPSVVHSIDGYDLLISLGFDGTANVCMTHSLPLRKPVSIQSWELIDQQTQEKFLSISSKLRWNIYDDIITVCDSLGDSHGFCSIEQRLISVALRHGLNEYSVKTWERYFSIKKEFDEIIGKSIYYLLPGIEKAIYK